MLQLPQNPDVQNCRLNFEILIVKQTSIMFTHKRNPKES